MNNDDRPQVPYWKVIVVGVLDLITAFFVLGWSVAFFSGQTTAEGFNLKGGPALLCLGLIVAYFVLAPRLGGTLWRQILRIPVQNRSSEPS